MVVNDVPGPDRPLYLSATPVRGVLVWAPTSGSVGMSVSIMSSNRHVTVGVMADTHLVPDPEAIVSAFHRERARLGRLYRSRDPGGGPPPRGAKARP